GHTGDFSRPRPVMLRFDATRVSKTSIVPLGEVVMTKVEEVMSPDVVTVPSTAAIITAARLMRDADVGDLVLTDHGEMVRIVRDREFVVGAVTTPRGTGATIGEICSERPAPVEPSASVERAAAMMRRYAIRRLPVVEHNIPRGIVPIGDLARVENPASTLAA